MLKYEVRVCLLRVVHAATRFSPADISALGSIKYVPRAAPAPARPTRPDRGCRCPLVSSQFRCVKLLGHGPCRGPHTLIRHATPYNMYMY